MKGKQMEKFRKKTMLDCADGYKRLVSTAYLAPWTRERSYQILVVPVNSRCPDFSKPIVCLTRDKKTDAEKIHDNLSAMFENMYYIGDDNWRPNPYV